MLAFLRTQDSRWILKNKWSLTFAKKLKYRQSSLRAQPHGRVCVLEERTASSIYLEFPVPFHLWAL